MWFVFVRYFYVFEELVSGVVGIVVIVVLGDEWERFGIWLVFFFFRVVCFLFYIFVLVLFDREYSVFMLGRVERGRKNSVKLRRRNSEEKGIYVFCVIE